VISSHHDYDRIMIRISLITGMLLLLAGCGQMIPSQTPGAALPSSPAEGDATEMTQPLPTPSDSSLQNLIGKARQDLARRLSISTDQINLAGAMEVTWPDASLGCPQEGMAYAQVLTPGYLILLVYAGNEFEYHASIHGNTLYCENPTPPILGTPADINPFLIPPP